MRRLWPDPLGQVSDGDLERLYAFAEPRERPWVCVSFVSSVDGAVTVSGRSGGLSDAADRHVFLLGRALSDVVLVGAGTARAEDYGGVKATEHRSVARQRVGRTGLPPVAVVSGRAKLRTDSRLFTDTEVAPIVLTTEAAPRQAKRALAEAGAEVIVAGEQTVQMPLVLAALAERGLLRVCCEGGPGLFGSLLAANAVDELRLTVSALLSGGQAGRIADGPTLDPPTGLALDSVLQADNTLLLRYLRQT